jgi:aspartate racemase
MKTIGIIGGMGPEATLDLFRKIIENTDAKKDQDHPHIIIDNYPAIPDRTAYLLGEGENPAPFLIESAKRLEAAGADMLCMPCNTAHYFAQDIKSEVTLPMVHIVEATRDAILNNLPNCKNVGLLATKGTFIGRVYHNILENSGIEIIDVPDEIQNDVMNVIYSVKGGRADEVVPLLQIAVDRLQDMGAEALIGGCTEIPLVIGKAKCKAEVIDPTLELAKAVVKRAVPEKIKI